MRIPEAFGPTTYRLFLAPVDCPPPRDALLTTWRRELLAVGVLVLLALLINLSTTIRGPGEPDAARHMNDALITHKSGSIYLADHRKRVLPLYSVMVQALVDADISVNRVFDILANLNAIAAALILVPLYLLWRRLTSADIAFAALIVVNFLPVFWVSHLYGFSHLPALLFAATALTLLFHSNLAPPGRAVWLALAALVAAAIAGGLKSDIILMAAAFPALLLFSPKVDVRRVAFAVVVPAALLVSPLVLADIFYQIPVFGLSNSADEWLDRWPASFATFVGDPNLSVMSSSAGLVLVLVAAIGAVRCLFERRLTALLVFMLAWSVPAIVFWGIREGNAARHILAAYVGLAPLVPIAIWGTVRYEPARLVALAGCLALNYFSAPPRADTFVPSTQLLRTPAILDTWVHTLLSVGNKFYRIDDQKKVLVGVAPTVFIQLPSLRRASTVVRRKRDDGLLEYLLTFGHGREQTLIVLDPRHQDISLVAGLREEGFSVWEYQRTPPGIVASPVNPAD